MEHLGAEQPEELAGERSGPERGHVENPQAGEGEIAGGRTQGRVGSAPPAFVDRGGAERRRGTGPTERHPLEAPGRAGSHESVGPVDEAPPASEVLDGRGVGAVDDRGVGEPERGRQVEDLVDAAGGHPGVDLGGERGPVAQVRAVVGPILAPDHGAEVEPLLARARTQPDHAVGRRRHPGGRHEPLELDRTVEQVVEGHRVVGQRRRERLEHRHVDQLTGRPLTERGEGADRGVQARHPLADLTTDRGGRPVGTPPGQSDDASRPGLEGELGRRSSVPRTGEPERADRGDHQVGVGVAENVRIAQGRLRHPGTPRRPHDDVGVGEQPVEGRGVAPVDDRTALTRAEVGEERTVDPVCDRGTRGRPAPQRVALRRLDLDDIGPAVGEQLGAVGPGDPEGQVDDAQPIERRRVRRAPGLSHRRPARTGPR